MDQTNYYTDFTSDYQGGGWQSGTVQPQYMPQQGYIPQSGYKYNTTVNQPGYYENFSTADGEEVKSEGTPTYDMPTGHNGEERGEKRAAEDSGAGNAKQAKDESPKANPVKNAIEILNEKVPGMAYTCLTSDHSSFTMHCMQATVGGQVFEANCTRKKKAKRMVAEAALKYLSDNNMLGTVSCDHPSTNPSFILNQIWPSTKYEFLEEMVENYLPYYRIRVTVEDQQFEAKGRSKQLAKSYAAMYALQKLFNLKFTIPDFERQPTFEGNEEEWNKYKKVKEVPLFEGRNPIQGLLTMYQPLWDFTDITKPGEVDKCFKCMLKIENVIFIGTGPTQTAAKALACFDALQYLKKHGMLEKKRAEAAVRKEQRLAELKAEQEAKLAATQAQSS